MRKLIAATGLALTPLVASQAQAALNLTATANYWDASPSGYIQGNSSQPQLDFTDELGLGDEGLTNLSLQFDHFVPLIPNLRLTQTSMEFTGNRNTSFTFLNQTFTGNTTSTIDLSHTDATAYYRFLDGLTSLIPLVSLRVEVGLTARMFDGGFEIQGDVGGNTRTESVDLSVPLPMGYLGGRVSLPFGLSVGAKLNTISYSGNGVTDFQGDVSYEFGGLPLITPGVTAGYREFTMTLDDLDDTYGDLTVDGAFFGAYVRAGF
ncbi:TIGR04219 family outer membrane beta-barrel protein [Marinospirillum perlucidum]|uniref:TIGR04219 family outer membrane beta-barrel protein n=1 Tax=Marinospirillum perlucidum TaxID=1982602 RepID=UPI000DF419DE|nr:TIGR04219 family outer membrane beta-barrel protein [Marinospirillum perlucidum]